ncbi:MAG: hypothetical protein ACRD6W_12975 [Nitrososphaerales archaeon]
MRSSLVVSGGIITLIGVVLLLALDGDAWLVMIGGGLVVIVAGARLPEITDRVEPPPGQLFCPYCSTLLPVGTIRCTHCNGLQDPQRAPAAPSV